MEDLNQASRDTGRLAAGGARTGGDAKRATVSGLAWPGVRYFSTTREGGVPPTLDVTLAPSNP